MLKQVQANLWKEFIYWKHYFCFIAYWFEPIEHHIKWYNSIIFLCYCSFQALKLDPTIQMYKGIVYAAPFYKVSIEQI